MPRPSGAIEHIGGLNSQNNATLFKIGGFGFYVVFAIKNAHSSNLGLVAHYKLTIKGMRTLNLIWFAISLVFTLAFFGNNDGSELMTIVLVLWVALTITFWMNAGEFKKIEFEKAVAKKIAEKE